MTVQEKSMIQIEDLDRPLEHHFTIFIYPFFHCVPDRGSKPELFPILRRWVPWFTRLSETQLKAALDDSYFFLPFAKRFVFPEFESIPNTVQGQEKLFRHAERFRDADPETLYTYVSQFPVHHLTLRQTELDSVKEFHLRFSFGSTSTDHAAIIDWADLFLFPHGTGFLALKMHLPGSPRLSHIIDFNALFRQVLPPKVGWTMAELHTEKKQNVQTGEEDIHSVRDLAERLLSGVATSVEKSPLSWRRAAPALSEETTMSYDYAQRYLESVVGQIYGDRFFTYSYACVDYPEEFLTEQLPNSSFHDPIDQVLYEFGTCTGLGSSSAEGGNFRPSPEYAESIMTANRIAMWRYWRALALRETVTFLAFKKNSFHLTYLPQNVENDYFNLYIYTLYQKIELFKFSTELLREENNPKESMKNTRALVDSFTEFRNRFWFVEITKRPQGDFIYEKYQEGLQSLPLFEAVSKEIADLNEYYEMKLNRKTNAVLAVLTFFLTPLALTISFWGMNVFQEIPWSIFALSLASVLSLASAIWYFVMEK